MRVFVELEVAYLARDIERDDVVFLQGTPGAIVFVHGDGEGYELEISKPRRDVLTLYPEDLCR